MQPESDLGSQLSSNWLAFEAGWKFLRVDESTHRSHVFLIHAIQMTMRVDVTIHSIDFCARDGVERKSFSLFFPIIAVSPSDSVRHRLTVHSKKKQKNEYKKKNATQSPDPNKFQNSNFLLSIVSVEITVKVESAKKR